MLASSPVVHLVDLFALVVKITSMNSEARLTRSAMRARASRGLSDELLELPAKPTPSRARSTLKTRLPFDELSNAQAAAPQSGSPVKKHNTSQPQGQYQTPAVKGSSTLSDVERMLLSPTPRLTPETSAKAADAEESAKVTAPIAEAEDLAAVEVAAAKAADSPVAPATAEQSDTAAEQAAAEAAEEAHAARVAAEVQAAADAALAEALQQAADAQAAADAAAAEQARLDEEAHAAKVAAEVQAAADAALEEALRQAAEAQAAAEAAPADAAEPEPLGLAPVPVTLQTSSDEGSDRWDIDGADDMVIQPAVEVAPAASAIKSKVVTSANFDSRSIRQLKKEIKVQYAKQATVSGITDGASSADEDEESVPSHVAAALTGALEGLSINSGSTAVAPLRGVPVAEGQHLRFDDETGEAQEASPMHMPLRGMPPRAGVHLRFDD